MEIETKTPTVPAETDAGISTIVYEKEPEPKGDLIVEVAKEHAKLPAFIANLDICFMLDCTGSMQSYIDRARNKIKDIIEEVKVQHPGSEIQVGIVGYRDVQDSKRFEVLPFTSNIQSAKDFLDGIRTYGGGDTPEDVNGAFQQALFKMEWSGQAKMIVHVADAPCHGKDYHSCNDNHPSGHKEDMAWETIFKQIVEQHIDYLFLQISSYYTEKMFNKFKEMAEGLGAAANGVLFKQEPITSSEIKNAAAAAAATTSLFTTSATTSSFIPSTAIFAKKKRAPRKETTKKEKKEKKETTKKSTARKSRSRKAASPSSSPSPSRSESKSSKKEKSTRKRKESDDEDKKHDSDWVVPTYWTRSKYREYLEHGGKEDKKDGYWTIPETGEVSVAEPRKRSTKKTRKPSVSKGRSEKRGRKASTKRKASKDKDRSEERTKKVTRGKSKKGDMLVENPLPKRAFIAPKHKGSSKIPATMPVMPTSFVGMSAMDEQEYFAKLLSKEMADSLHRRKDAMK